MQRTGLLALAATCALAGVAVFLGVLRSERAGARDEVEPAVVTSTRPAPEPRDSKGTEPAALAPVLRAARATTSPPPAEDNVPLPPAGPPARGWLRVQGIVVDSYTKEPVESPGATVSAQVKSRWRDEYVLFGKAEVRVNGRFWFDVPTPSRAEHGVHPAVYVAFSGAGYEPAAAAIARSDLESGVVNVTIEADTGGPLVEGRIVDARSRPVAGATVIITEWGPHGLAVGTTYAAKTLADGRFSAEISRTGWVDVLAHQVSVGVAKTGARLERGERSLDVGDMVLEERGVLAGTVRGLDGTPIAKYPVQATEHHDFHDGEDHFTETDSEGRFRFAYLERGPHRIDPPLETHEPDRPSIVNPDHRDPVLRIADPTATVTVLDASGSPVDPDTLAVGPIKKHPRSGLRSTQASVDRIDVGRYSVLFGRPGPHGAFALDERGGTSWFAEATIDAGRTHVELTLRLRRRVLTKVQLRVDGVDGTEADDWRVALLDPESRLQVTNGLSSRKPVALVPTGSWLASVRPRGDAMFVAFEQSVDVPQTPSESPLAIRLTARREGGRLQVFVSDEADGRRPVRLQVRSSGPQQIQIDRPRWTANHPSILPGTLAPGTYVVEAQRLLDGTRRVRSEVEIEPGKTVRVNLALP
ncbi:MAG: hypothetical protein AAGB93_00165 [Planctomycetota bacterium]